VRLISEVSISPPCARQGASDESDVGAQRTVGKRDTTQRGDVAEFQVIAALVGAGHRLLRPLSAACRYDLLIDNEDGGFTRVQCKNGVLKAGSVVFRLCSVSRRGNQPVPYQGDVDAFGVYCAATGRAYLVPMSAVSHRTTIAYLRVAPARNGQRHGVGLAADFLIHQGPRASGT